jgi:hypothetical protein
MHRLVVQREEPCLGRLAVVWGGFGLAMALLSQALQVVPFGPVLAWGAAALGAICLIVCCGEF